MSSKLEGPRERLHSYGTAGSSAERMRHEQVARDFAAAWLRERIQDARLPFGDDVAECVEALEGESDE